MAKLLTSLPEEVQDLPSDDVTKSNDALSERGEEDIDDDRHHAKLLDAISSLDGVKRLKHTLRTEPGKEVSEFGFKTNKDDNQSLLSELMNSVNKTASHTDLKRPIKQSQKRVNILPAPLPKHEKEKIQRTVGYEKVVTEVTKWDSVVDVNRKADQMKFPLLQPNTKLINSHFKFTPRTPLELEIAAALKQRDPENVIKKGQVLTPAEEKALAAMSLEEAQERRAELLKYRALLYNRESKLRWQNKIKSKRYRRVLKKERQKKDGKELEELARTDPEAFLQRLDKAETDRMQERMRLRHRGGGKFAKQAKMYAKFDDKKREEIQAMLRKGKDLTQKLKVESSESEAEDNADAHPDTTQLQAGSETTKNPWMQVQNVKKPVFAHPQPVMTGDSEEKTEQAEDSEEEMDEIDKLFAEGNEKNKFAEGSGKQRKRRDKREKKGKNMEGKEKQGHMSKDPDKRLKDTEKLAKKVKPGKKNLTKRQSTATEKEVNAEKAADEESLDADSSDSSDSKSDNSDDEINSHQDVTNSQKKLSVTGKPVTHASASTVHGTCHMRNGVKEPDSESEEEEEAMLAETTDLQITEDALAHNAGDLEPIAENSKGKSKKDKKRLSNETDSTSDKPVEFVDPKKLLSLKSKPLKSKLDDDVSDDGDDSDEDIGNRLTIAEAFEDDDVVAEFVEEKRRVADEEKAKDIDLTLPGWGEWGGVGLQPSKKKKERFTIKAKREKRADQHLGHVIITKKKNAVVEKHLVSKLPFPYKSPADFSSTMKTPIGREWNTENAFKRMTKPAVVTRSGTIIEPVDESVLLKKPAKRSAEVDIQLDVQKSDGKRRRKHRSRKK